MIINRSNLITALKLAIQQQYQAEVLAHYTSDSALLSGWKNLLEALKKGEEITINNK